MDDSAEAHNTMTFQKSMKILEGTRRRKLIALSLSVLVCV